LFKKYILCVLILSIILLILFFKFFFGGKIFLPADILRKELPWKYQASSEEVQNHYIADNIHVHYPWKVYLADEIKRGNFPLWCPLVGGGYPLFANPHYQYNLFLPFLFLFDTSTAYNLVLILELFLSGLFMFILLREYKAGFSGALIASIAYMLNFYFMDTLFHEQQLGTMMWLPLIFIFFEKYKKINKIHYLGLAALFTAFALFQGSIQSILFVYLAIFLYFVFELFGKKTLKQRSQSLFALVGVTIFSIFLGAIALIPIVEFLSFSADSKIGFSFLKWLKELPRILLSLPFLIGSAFPDFLGSHQALDTAKFLGLGGNVNGNLFKAYVGIIPLFFIIFSLLFRKNMLIKKYLFIGLGPIILIVFTPLYYFLYFRGYIVTVFALSILAGLGADYFLKKEFDMVQSKRLLKILIILFMIIFSLIALVNGVFLKYEDTLRTKGKEFVSRQISSGSGLQYDIDWQLKKVDKMIDHYKITSPSMYIPLLIITLLLILVNFYIKNKMNSKIFLLIIFPIMIFDLLRFGWQLIPFVEKSEIFPKIKSIDFLKNDKSNFRVASVWETTKSPPVFHPNTLLPYRIDNIDLYESITMRTKLKDDIKNFRYLSVKYIICPPEYSIKLENTYKEIYKKEVRILRNMDYLDKIRFKSEVIPCDDKNKIKNIIEKKNLDIYNISLILTKNKHLKASFKDSNLNSGEIIRTEPNKIFIDLYMKNDGFMEIGCNYYPGWHAYVDGEKEMTYISNNIFMGVFLPKGEHSVVLSFQPLSLKLGMYISLISFLSLMAIIIAGNGVILNRRNSNQSP